MTCVTSLPRLRRPATRSLPRHRARLLALVGLVALTLSGCVRMDIAMTLHPDDTVDGSMVMAISDEVATSMGMDPQTLWDEAMAEGGTELPEGGTQEPYAQDGYTGVRYTLDPAPISAMTTAGDVTDDMRIVREGDEFVLDGTMDLTEMTADAAGDDASAQMQEAMLDQFDIRLSFTFPGEVTEHNGTLDGTTVVWTPAPGDQLVMHARGSAVEGGSAAASQAPTAGDDATAGADSDDPAAAATADDGDTNSGIGGLGIALIVVGAVVILALVGVIIWLVVRSRRPAVPAVPAATGTWGPYGPTSGSSPAVPDVDRGPGASGDAGPGTPRA